MACQAYAQPASQKGQSMAPAPNEHAGQLLRLLLCVLHLLGRAVCMHATHAGRQCVQLTMRALTSMDASAPPPLALVRLITLQ